MRLGDVQNLYGKTLDAQALMQQAMSAPETAARQAAAHLTAERRRRQAQVEGSEASMAAEPDPFEKRPRQGLGKRIDIKA